MNTHMHLTIGVVATLAIASAITLTGCGHKSDDNGRVTVVSQVDRVGMPAVATALITDKDTYNAASPHDDAASMFVPQITTNLDSIHTKLNDDITAAGLRPTNTAGSLSNAAAAIVPDTLKINTAVAANFPNGRRLADPVIDRTLSLILLVQSATPTPAQDINTLANLPLNPPANDKAFSSTFPYLATPF